MNRGLFLKWLGSKGLYNLYNIIKNKTFIEKSEEISIEYDKSKYSGKLYITLKDVKKTNDVIIEIPMHPMATSQIRKKDIMSLKKMIIDNNDTNYNPQGRKFKIGKLEGNIFQY